jgi:hypothetical protein
MYISRDYAATLASAIQKKFLGPLALKNPPKFVLEAESSRPFGHYSKNFPARWDLTKWDRLIVQESTLFSIPGINY